MKPIYKYHADNEQATEQLAGHLAAVAVPGTVITLDGDLGAGKTRFSQGFARAIGVSRLVNSPTFTIIKEYEGTKLPFYHMDVYRIGIEDTDDLGLDEYFYGDGVTLIEWSKQVEDILPSNRLEIVIERTGNQLTERIFRLIPHGEPYVAWCAAFKGNGWIL